jgi:hypothetical protein
VLELHGEKDHLEEENQRLKRQLADARGEPTSAPGRSSRGTRDAGNNADESSEDEDGEGDNDGRTRKARKKDDGDTAASRRVLRARRLGKKLIIMGALWPPTLPEDDESGDSALEQALHAPFTCIAPDPTLRYNDFARQFYSYCYELAQVFGADFINEHGQKLWSYLEVRVPITRPLDDVPKL